MKKLIFYAHSNEVLAKKLAKLSGLQIGMADIKKFADKEIFVLIKENVKNKIVYVLGSTFPPAENLIELLILIHTLKANGAKKVQLIIPYFGYAKADHIDPPGMSLAAKLMVELFETSGVDEFIAVDIHSPTVVNFFKKPLLHISAIPLLAGYFKKKKLKDLAIASPDLGGVKRAAEFAKILQIDQIVTIEKYRPTFDQVKVEKVVGEIKGKNIIIVDDMIQSGSTIIKAVQALKKHGAKDIYVAVSHLVFSGPSVPLLAKNKDIKEVVFADTILPKAKLPMKFKKISVADLLCSIVHV